jgi:S-adenosylmethionine:tRNA ribosyltransferase-isomerase
MSNSFRLDDLEYELPVERIAQAPLERRDAARLLVVNRVRGCVNDAWIVDLPGLLRAGDCLVINDTRVVPAKFELRRRTGGRIEGLFLREIAAGRWEVLLRGAARVREHEALAFAGNPEITGSARRAAGPGHWELELSEPLTAEVVLRQVGRTPLPHYIRRASDDEGEARDRQRYQTVYARRPGAVAAPTAGLHFTEELLAEITRRGVRVAPVTLHVGLGTFAPIAAERIEQHAMHPEWYEVAGSSAKMINAARAAGGRIVAVGTTAARVLETCVDQSGRIQAGQGWTDLFIYPPYHYRAIDALLTNFHLPRSTLLALVMAYGGRELVRLAYRHAVEHGYRFYSYGDAMLIV